MRARLVLSVLLSEQFLPSRVDVRPDGILSYRSDVSPLADSVAFCLLDDDHDPIDRLVNRAIAGDQLGEPFEKVLLLPGKRALGEEFETMGEFAAWACYATSLTTADHVGESTAKTIRSLRPTLVRWFGGEEYIPQFDGEQETLVIEDTDEDDRNEETAEDDPSIAASGKS